MTDRELLELAAKAAGLNLQWQEGRATVGDWLRRDWWGPLTDDGDALRLLAKLKINIEHMETLKRVPFGINCWPVGRGDCGVSEDEDISDYASSIRRAIVRAAAEIGKAMP